MIPRNVFIYNDYYNSENIYGSIFSSGIYKHVYIYILFYVNK